MTVALDRSSPPKAGRPAPFHFPRFERFRLDNGLEVFLAPRQGVPTIELSLLLPAGAERNPRDRPGLATLTAALLDEGSLRRTGPEIAATIERLGARLATRADWNGAQIEVDLLARDLATGVELLAELAREPQFPDHELERLRRQAMTELIRRRDQPALLAEEALARALYFDTPYEHLLLGSEQSVPTLARADVVEFHRSWYRPAGAAVLIGGDFEPAAARAMLERSLGDWRDLPAAPPSEILAPRRDGRSVLIVDRPRAAQTELRLAHVGIRRDHPQRNRLALLNALLGGKFTSRINLNLRERHGFTYGASSRFVERRSAGPFVVGAAVANQVAGAAAREVLAELDRLRREPVADDELAETQSYLVGVFPYTLQTTGGVLSRLQELATYGLPNDTFDRALDEIAAASPRDLLRLANDFIRPEEILIVAVGPAEQLRPQLGELGPVEVVEIAPAPGAPA